MLSKWQNINFVVNYSFMCICAAEVVENGTMRVLTLCVADGATVYAPFDVKLNGKAVPYKKNNAINDGINLSGEGLYLHLHIC